MDNNLDDHHEEIPTVLVALDKSLNAFNRYVHHQQQHHQQQQQQHLPPSRIRGDHEQELVQFLQKLQDDVGTCQENLEYYKTMIDNRVPSHHSTSHHMMNNLDHQDGTNPPNTLNDVDTNANNNGIYHDNHDNGMSTTEQEETTSRPRSRSPNSIVTHTTSDSLNPLPQEMMVNIFCKYLNIRTLIVERKPYELAEGLMVNIMTYLDVRTLIEIKPVSHQFCTLSTIVINGKGIGTTRKAFDTNGELRLAVRRYCGPLPQGGITTQQYCHRDVAEEIAYTYGWPISKWDVSNIENFDRVFSSTVEWNVETQEHEPMGGISLFNENISEWNISQATTMSRMFSNAEKFNQDISKWDVSNVTNMENMFYYAETFDQDISEWDVSNVREMKYV